MAELPPPPPDKPVRSAKEAMQVLHAVLPPGCGITLTKVDWYSAEPDQNATPLRRSDPLRCSSSREWGLAVTYTGPEGAYEQIETGRALDAVARGAGAKFLACGS